MRMKHHVRIKYYSAILFNNTGSTSAEIVILVTGYLWNVSTFIIILL